MYFDQVTGDGKSQSQAAVVASGRAISLSKSIENVRQKLLVYSLTSI